MNENPNTRTAELFDAMVATYETWAEPLSARLAQVAPESVKAGVRGQHFRRSLLPQVSPGVLALCQGTPVRCRPS
jgi:hypothetical protein